MGAQSVQPGKSKWSAILGWEYQHGLKRIDFGGLFSGNAIASSRQLQPAVDTGFLRPSD
jgi:hypothetical protein